METAKMKEKLIEEEKLLNMELKRLGRVVNKEGDWEAVPEVLPPESDENDLADKFEDFEERSAMLKTLGARMKDVQDAIVKMKENKFGKCETCAEKIEEERLMANPAARTCIKHMQ